MRAHYLQHVAFEGLGAIEPWLVEQGYQITATRFDQDGALPEPQAVDLLIVMGGPMGVNEGAQYPWLAAEKRFVRECIALGKPVLGVCLGAQVIASALGARVYANTHKEIGWLPVQGTGAGGAGVFRFPASQTVFHWHGETFDLPDGAVHLARSEGCEHQAFQWGPRVIGLQFHLEATPATTQDMVTHGQAELQPARYVQSAQDILAAAPRHCAQINALLGQVLAFLKDGAA
ncbi:MAG: gamma-glutamyl-gamma-aminobutyrate hydrolase family protein [Burkholderiales bacterium]|jgi:GMP synthase-like glutamine amidotransferase|nr:gamma-glutamyl-gamma-aminobutyrate hydrolase family protein [Burkholderiales bacterium]